MSRPLAWNGGGWTDPRFHVGNNQYKQWRGPTPGDPCAHGFDSNTEGFYCDNWDNSWGAGGIVTTCDPSILSAISMGRSGYAPEEDYKGAAGHQVYGRCHWRWIKHSGSTNYLQNNQHDVNVNIPGLGELKTAFNFDTNIADSGWMWTETPRGIIPANPMWGHRGEVTYGFWLSTASLDALIGTVYIDRFDVIDETTGTYLVGVKDQGWQPFVWNGSAWI